MIATCAVLLACANSPTAPQRIEISREPGLEGFPARLDSIRVQLRIPGMAVAIVHDGRIVWSAGFGFADATARRRATPTTPFHLASLTKPFAAVIVMQLVEQGLVDLDDPVSDYGVSLSAEGVVRVRHLLNHTSEGIPGTQYRYSGNRYGNLDQVIQSATGRTFADLLAERVLEPLGLQNTAPSPAQPAAFAFTGLDIDRFRAEMAAGYSMSGGEIVPTGNPTYFGTAAGLVASAEDMAAFSIAIDRGRFLDADTWTRVFTPAVSTASGDTLPYGLGWFIQRHEGVTLQWHYGYWTTNSSLIVRVPDRHLAFVVLANTPALSAAYPGLGSDENVLRSDVARLFVDAFVTGDEPLPGTGPAGRGG
ncbi:MAG: serine hydrolase domain-containing protein [Gemmatimonadota bacterium]|jgi:CubicO group peptidase (beta-lactamase class C family)